jgi:hypothetical protein
MITRREAILAAAALCGAPQVLLNATTDTRPDDTDKCPSCGRLVHYCCADRECTCWSKLKPEELPLRVHRVAASTAGRDIEVLACPYCCYAMTIDGWFELWMEKYSTA